MGDARMRGCGGGPGLAASDSRLSADGVREVAATRAGGDENVNDDEFARDPYACAASAARPGIR